MSRLPVPIVVVVTGEGGSGGALALAVGDRVLMMENSYYSVISPEGCSTILFKDAAQAPRAAEALRMTAPDLLRLKIMDARRPRAGGRRARGSARRRREPEDGDRVRARGAHPARAGRTPRRPLPRFRLFGTPGEQPVLPPTGEDT